MAKRSVDIIVRARDQASAKFGKIGQSSKSLGGSLLNLKNVLVGAGLLTALYALRRGLSSSVQAFKKQEAAVHGLSAALGFLNAGGPAAMKSMQDFAAEMQKSTVYGDELVMEMMTLGATLGRLSGKGLQDATKAAIGLGEVIGKDLNTAMLLMARAAVGDTSQLTRYGIKISELLSPQEKLNELIRRGIEGFALAQARTKTLEGSTAQLKNAWGDLQEVAGGLLAPALQSLAQRLKEVTESTNEAFSESRLKIITTTARAVGVVADAVYYLGLGFKAIRLVMMEACASGAEAFTKLAQIIVDVHNKLADTWLGGKLGLEHKAVREGITALSKELRISVIKARAELVEAWSEGMAPSGRIAAWVKKLYGKAAAASKAAAAAAAGFMTGGPAMDAHIKTHLEYLAQVAAAEESWARKIAQLKINLIKDEQQRAIALINERYDFEVKEAVGNQRVIAQINAARELELRAVTKAEGGAAGRTQDRGLAAFESRYLKNAPGVDAASKTAKHTEILVKQAEKRRKDSERQTRALELIAQKLTSGGLELITDSLGA